MTPPNQPAAAPRSLIVHQAHRPPAPVLRYIDQVVGTSTPGIEFRFSQGVLTEFDVDAVHVVDRNLDRLLGTRRASSTQRLIATAAFVRNLRRHRIALVRTLHGLHRHRSSRVDRLAIRLIDSATTTFVVFDDATRTPDSSRTVVIPHAEFSDRFLGYPRGEQVAGRVLCITAGALPVAAEDLLGIPRAVSTDGVSLRLVGVPPEQLAASARSALARHGAVFSMRPELVSDGAQVQEIDSAELVVLPQTSALEDLQTALLALSRHRPVLTTHSEPFFELARAVGPGWVHLSAGPITAEDVDAALASLRSTRTQYPNLEGRDLPTIRAAYAEVFRSAIADVRG